MKTNLHNDWEPGVEESEELSDKGTLTAHLAPHKNSAARRAGRVIGRVLAVLFVLLLAVASLAFGAVHIIFTGPSPVARDRLVVSLMETSALKFVPRMYYTDNEIDDFLSGNAVVVFEEVTEPAPAFTPLPEETAPEDIRVVDVTGPTFKGKMMIVNDPARLQLATIPAFGEEANGKKVETLVAEAGAVAGINAGGFKDEGGVGTGGQPLGLIIADGRIRNGGAGTTGTVIGFDAENHLIVGRMSGQQALDRNMRCAVSFEPALIVNGVPAEVLGSGGGLNPRTAIGQRADGAVLLLVVDGRQPHSIGASLGDLVDVMRDFGAVNAANLDGGSSSMLVYNGEIINVCASLYGSRRQPAAFVVAAQ